MIDVREILGELDAVRANRRRIGAPEFATRHEGHLDGLVRLLAKEVVRLRSQVTRLKRKERGRGSA